MQGIISSFKRAKHRQYTDRAVILIDTKDLKKFINKTIMFKTQTGREIKGIITKLHGKHALLARFERGLPGQALSQKVTIQDGS